MLTRLLGCTLSVTLLYLSLSLSETDEGSTKWHGDFSNQIKIALATKGYSRAVLECDADWIAFVVSLEEDFDGVIYTRGSFHTKKAPCFLNADGGKDFALKFPYDQCGVKHDSNLGGYTTTVVVQKDQDLITPGDLGFRLLCRDQMIVNASFDGVKSKISLVEADPAASGSQDGGISAMSPSNLVTLTPPKVDLNPRPKREEL